MLNILTKTAKEIQEEDSLYAFGAQVAKGVKKNVCHKYLVKADGTKVDTVDLKEKDILLLIKKDLKTSQQGVSSFELAKLVKDFFKFSPAGLVELMELEEIHGHIVADIRGSFGTNLLTETASQICLYNKQTNGDFSKLTKDEVRNTLLQMQKNFDKTNKRKN